MLKYLTHKLKTQSINEENLPNEKIDGHDSGTESDGDLDTEDFNERDIELSMSSRHDTTSPTDTACSSESPAFLTTPQSDLLLYDQHSSEEELEVINGSTTNLENLVEMSNCNEKKLKSNQKVNLSVSQDDEDTSPKRCSSSTFLEKRKRSLAHNSDDEVRHLLESQPYHHHHNMLAPVNFRTSPPLEALKPHRGHILLNHQHHHNRNNISPHQRSTTPLILVEAGRGIENIRISCDSPVAISNGSGSSSTTTPSLSDLRSISPPAKVFAVSPRHRRQLPRHQTQRLQRRPCLDFDKMQLKARSVTTWSNNEHSSGELSVFCW